MNLGRVWDIIHAVLKKEGRGNIIKPERFTYLLQQCHYEYYNQQYQKWGGSQNILDSLSPFVVSDEAVTLASGVFSTGSLAKTFKHPISARISSSNIPYDIVTMNQWNNLISDAAMGPEDDDPIMIVFGGTISVMPVLSGDIKFSYLKEADDDPFFDYYIDTRYRVQYLAPGTSHTLIAGEVYRDGTTTGTKTSVSKELEWNDADIVNIISMLLEKIAVGMQATDVAQYAMALEQKQNVM